jgi:hypothetical protein
MHMCMSRDPRCNTNAAVRPIRASLMAAAQGARDDPLRVKSRTKAMLKLSEDARPVYTVDAEDRLALVNPAATTLLCGFEHKRPQELLGRSIWEFVPGAQIRQLWQVLYSRVRALGAPVFVPMRADTPELRRLVDLELHPLADRSIQHISECVWTEPRPAIALLDPAYPRDQRSLLSCAWCRRIQVRLGAWEEIEQAQQTLRIEAVETLPMLKSAVCASCKQSVLKTFPARVA